MHDYFNGMICTREGGIQMPEMIKRHLPKGVFSFFTAFVCITLALCGAVFIYTPGDIASTQLFGFGGTAGEASTWIIYGVIFVYYLIATVLPIDKIIGKVYPIFGAVLILSAVGIFVMIFAGGHQLAELFGSQMLGGFDFGAENSGITMQLTDAGWEYYQSVNGVLAQISPTSVVGVVCRSLLGNIGGIIAIIGVIILPVTTGDTALRSLRLTVAETFHIRQQTAAQRILLALPIFVLTLGILIWAKNDPNGFNTIRKYFGWANQTLSVFATSSIMIYLMRHGKTRFMWMPAIPFVFYSFVTSSYLLSAPVGFALDITVSYIIAGVFSALIFAGAVYLGKKQQENRRDLD